ncbi:MAG: cyclodeaminase/cyclohydrolase family protein [Thermaerobacter sp.]|nr:cyclodeaminase/cyclohydrolase family protein [Thermaerobacter sp.]
MAAAAYRWNAADTTLADWIEQLAHPGPVFAGGSAAAVAAAEGFALLALGAGVMERRGNRPSGGPCQGIATDARTRMHQCLQLAGADARAMAAAWRVHPDDAELARVLPDDSLRIPLALAEQSVSGLGLLHKLLQRDAGALVADFRIAALLLRTALIGALGNARANLGTDAAAGDADGWKERIDGLAIRGEEMWRRVATLLGRDR